MDNQAPMNKLDDMMKILQRKEKPRSQNSADHQEDENGQLNPGERESLIKCINEMKCLLQKDDRKRNSEGASKCGCYFWQRPSTKTVQLYVPENISSESTKLFSQFLDKALKGIFISCEIVEKSNSKAGLPLLLICPMISRTEPIIDYALAEFNWEKPFIVIIVNHGTEENLPEIATSKKLPLKNSYQKITFIDMAFNKDEKLYVCSMNYKAMCIIKDFVDKFK